MNGSLRVAVTLVLALALVLVCVAGCGGPDPETPGAARGLTLQAAPPPDWKAINAVGIGLLVPEAWRVDGRCTDEVTTPLGLERTLPGASCRAPAHRQLFIEAIGLASDGPCVSPQVEFRIGADRRCLQQYGVGHFGLTVGTGGDLVSISMIRTTQAEAVRIMRTAQAVDLDNRGCTSRYRSSAPDKGPSVPSRRLTACVYRATEKRYPHRLWWSAELDTAAASAVLDRATASRPRPPPCLMPGAPPLIIELHASDWSAVTASIDECTRVATVGSGHRARYLGPADADRLRHLVTGAYR